MKTCQYLKTKSTSEYRHTYPRQNSAQDAFFELDTKTGLVNAMFNPEIGNAVPFSVYHGFDRRYGFCPKLKLRTVNKIAEKCIPLWQRVIDGAEETWNGNNNVLVLNEDAQAAEKQIRDIILYFESQN